MTCAAIVVPATSERMFVSFATPGSHVQGEVVPGNGFIGQPGDDEGNGQDAALSGRGLGR
jgi:hypothetical protein